MLLAVVLVVSGALVAGAAWGIYGKLPERLEGFLVALAGGALLLSVTTELIEPSIETASVFHAMLGVAAGAGVRVAGTTCVLGVMVRIRPGLVLAREKRCASRRLDGRYAVVAVVCVTYQYTVANDRTKERPVVVVGRGNGRACEGTGHDDQRDRKELYLLHIRHHYNSFGFIH